MSKKPSSRFFKKPHQEEFLLGKIPVTAEYVTSEKYPITCEAFSSLRDCELKDDIIRSRGTDDYSTSLKELMDAFDAFVQEENGRKFNTGHRKNFDLSCSEDFTLFLLWQIRHVLTHRGRLIDEDCIRNYEKMAL